MQRSNIVDLLIETAQKKRDEAAMRLAESQARCLESEKKLEMLNQYLAEYRARQRVQGKTSTVVLANLHAFLGKLEAAIARQGGEVLTARWNAKQARQSWERASQHLKSIEVLQRRREQVARQSADRTQQKTHDELATRMAAYPLAMAG